MYNQYIKSFIIGSSYPVFILYFYSVLINKNKNYSYENYTLIAPIFLGLLNVFGYYIKQKFELSRIQRFVITAILGASIVSFYATITNSYNLTTQNEWFTYYIEILLLYLFVFGIIVNLLDYSI